MVLPSSQTTSRAVPQATARSWIVGGFPGAPSDRIAARFGAHRIFAPASIFQVSRKQARPLARALRQIRALSFAEPNTRISRQSFPSDPLTPQQQWLPQVVPPDLTPPAVGPSSPVLGILESSIASVPDTTAGNVSGAISFDPQTDLHGTAVTAVASAPANGQGIVGVWPGMRIAFISHGLGTCSSAVQAISQAIELGASVINMSYVFPDPNACFAHYLATQYAVGADIVPVAAAGNEYGEGNPVESPGGDPHIVTVAALNPDLSSAYFSNENPGIDVSAPGASILTAVPPAADGDGVADGYERLDGTSFSSPMVAAVAAWIRQVRPSLSEGQVAGLIDYSATDLGVRGYDNRFGWGLVNLRGALTDGAPRYDPNEPNDDIEWVSGRRFRRPDPFLWHPGQRVARVRGTVDVYEDPADVFRVQMAPRSLLVFKLKPAFGDADLEVWDGRARTIYRSTRLRVGLSQRSGRRADVLTISNPTRSRLKAYVDAFVPSNVRLFNAAYKLTVRGLRH